MSEKTPLDPELRADLVAALQRFIERRRKGGILLTNECIATGEFTAALYETGIRQRPEPEPKIPIIGRKTGDGEQEFYE